MPLGIKHNARSGALGIFLQGGAIRNRGKFRCVLFSDRLRQRLLFTAIISSVVCVVCSCGRAPQAAQTAPPPPLQLVAQWGEAGSEPGQFQNPQAISCDAVGNIFIADDGTPTQVEKFDEQGHPLLDFAALGTQNDWDIAVDPGGAIFLLDRRHAEVQIFSPEGAPFRNLFFHYRRDFHNPSSLAIGRDGNFFVADSVSGRVMRVSPRGRALEGWGKPAGVDGRWMPYAIRLAPDGNLYAADAASGRIVRLTSVGRYVASWQFLFTDPDPSSSAAPRLDGLAISAKFVAASDAKKRLLEIWTLDGQSKLTVDFANHPEWGEHVSPTDIAFSPKGDLFILDRPDSRVLRFKVNIGT